MDDGVTLRLVAEDDLPFLERLTQDPDVAGEFAWLGWRDLSRSGWRTMGIGQWSGAAGTCGHGRPRDGDRGQRRDGTQAHRLLARYLFAHTTVHRIEADTEAGNVAEQRALEKAGFTREGVLRGVFWRDGAWRDGVGYSLLRTDQPG